jgi:hypothetical protein
MADTVRTVDYFALDVPQRAGKGAELLGALARGGVNLLAVHAFPSARAAQVDLVPQDPRALARAARRAGLRLGRPKKAFLVQGDDRIGAVGRVLAKLGDAGINVKATTALAAGRGRYGAILWVKPADVRRAARALDAK